MHGARLMTKTPKRGPAELENGGGLRFPLGTPNRAISAGMAPTSTALLPHEDILDPRSAPHATICRAACRSW